MYFLANNSKILSSYRSSDSSFYRLSASGAKVGVWGLAADRPGQRSKVGASSSVVERCGEAVFRWPRFPIISHVSFSRACIDSGSSTRLSRRPIVDIRKGSESKIGEGESQPTETSLSLFHRSFPLSFHLLRARACVRVRV